MAEGIPVDLVEFSDNRPVLDMLLSRPLGLLALLDEESRFPRATDRSFIGKFLEREFICFFAILLGCDKFYIGLTITQISMVLDFFQKNATTTSNRSTTFDQNPMPFVLQFITSLAELSITLMVSWRKIETSYQPKLYN